MADLAAGWLRDFEAALAEDDIEQLADLFVADGHWRDILAFTWHFTQVSGRERIVSTFGPTLAETKATAFMSTERVPPRRVTRAGFEVVEVLFEFATAVGPGRGVARLVTEAEGTRALSVFTCLNALNGFDEALAVGRPAQESLADFGGPNWFDRRAAAAQYTDREPTVLIIGAGQAGLSLAARLGQLEVDTLIVESLDRVGDVWRNRYRSLVLHNEIGVNHLPYLPFPSTWQPFLPKDRIAAWFETYVESLDLSVWTGTELVAASYDEGTRRWTATLRRTDGTVRTLSPRHVVMATGHSGLPNIPDLPGLADFAGEVMHSHGFIDGSPYAGKRALVIGTGNSGHDVAQDLHSFGADVTLVQRSSTTVASADPSSRLMYAPYREFAQIEDCDLVSFGLTVPFDEEGHAAHDGGLRRHRRGAPGRSGAGGLPDGQRTR